MGVGIYIGIGIGTVLLSSTGTGPPRAIPAQMRMEVGTASGVVSEAFADPAEMAMEVGDASAFGVGIPAPAEIAMEVGSTSGIVTEGTATAAEIATEVDTASGLVTEGTAVAAEIAMEVAAATGTATDGTAPAYSAFSVSQAVAGGDIAMSADVEPGETSYFKNTVAVPNGETAPTIGQIIAGTKADDSAAPFWISGFEFSTDLVGQAVAFDRQTELNQSLDWYSVVLDSAGNQSARLFDLNVTINTLSGEFLTDESAGTLTDDSGNALEAA